MSTQAEVAHRQQGYLPVSLAASLREERGGASASAGVGEECAPLSPSSLDAYQVAARIMREGGCWIWQGAVDRDGYGRVKLAGKNRLAHRAFYEELVEPIPNGLTLDHLCRNRACVNPEHLEPVPLATNIRRGEGAGVQNGRKTHCDHGHKFTRENTYITRRGTRSCRECGREAVRAYRARLRVAA